MRIAIASGMLVAGLLVGVGTATAHHSFTAEFDAKKPVTLKGVVTKVEWTNPHVWIYLNVKDDSGKVTNWGAELGPPHGLQSRGWRRNTLEVGTEITVEGSLAKNGTSRMNARTVTVAATGGRPGEKLDASSSANSKDDDK
jgi:Family of unknown function (DUF6152)